MHVEKAEIKEWFNENYTCEERMGEFIDSMSKKELKDMLVRISDHIFEEIEETDEYIDFIDEFATEKFIEHIKDLENVQREMRY